MRLLSVLLLLVPFSLFADARFVEAPAECHFPYDNANVDNEYKVSSCSGVLQSYAGGGRATALVYVEHKNIQNSPFIIDGADVTDQEAFPGGLLAIETTGDDSGTACNIVDANGTTYSTSTWKARTEVRRTQNKYRVNVSYALSCWGGAQVAQ